MLTNATLLNPSSVKCIQRVASPPEFPDPGEYVNVNDTPVVDGVIPESGVTSNDAGLFTFAIACVMGRIATSANSATAPAHPTYFFYLPFTTPPPSRRATSQPGRLLT